MVPDGGFESIEPALYGLGGRASFKAKAFAVDDAHNNREATVDVGH